MSLILVIAPVSSTSGYGGHSRDLVRSLMKIYPSPEHQIVIQRTSWGMCPDSSIDPEIDKLVLRNALNQRPDILFQVGIPNEFNPIPGCYNIGITAGTEGTLASGAWIEGMNKMDLLIVPSKFTKDVFEHSSWKRDDNGMDVRMQKKIEVLFEGVDISVFRPIENFNTTIYNEIQNIPTDFNFLFCGHWLKGEHQMDRKNVGGLIETFLKSFYGSITQPGLIIKTSMGTSAEKFHYEILNRIDIIKGIVAGELKCKKENLPPVYLLHGDLTEQELNELYNHPKINAMVSFTRGEGYGRPFAEWSAATNKPLIVPNWSGQLDFCKNDSVCLLNGRLEKIHPSAVWENILIPEASWFTVDYKQAENVLKRVYEMYDYFKRRSNTQHKHILENYTLDNMTERFKTILDRNVKIVEQPKFIPLKPR